MITQISENDPNPSEERGQVILQIDGPVARVIFDNASSRNAMTLGMYEQFVVACKEINNNHEIRVAVLRGKGGKAFIAGSDINQFKTFASAEDALTYENKITEVTDTLEKLSVPIIAVIEGCAIGGGLAIANICDIRIATHGAKFGVPIAKTLGNCLSAANTRRLYSMLGMSWTKRMLLLAETPTAEELLLTGYLADVVETCSLDEAVNRLIGKLLANAPLSIFAARETIRRLSKSFEPDISDLLKACYGSNDFQAAVGAFSSKIQVRWEGR